MNRGLLALVVAGGLSLALPAGAQGATSTPSARPAAGAAAPGAASVLAQSGPTPAPASASASATTTETASSAFPSRGRAAAARPAASLPAASPATTATAGGGVGINLRLPEVDATTGSAAVRIVLGLTLLAILPALLVCATAFLRIVIVLSMLRHAIGMPETPPNTAVIGLALFLTLFTMAPVLQPLNTDAVQPFLQGRIGAEAAWDRAARPLRDFMVRQTREQDIALMLELAKAPRPETIDDVSTVQLVPAFMLSELRAAFQIAFVVFLPFLLIDLIVSSVLMALGMMMMPPVTVALPLKLLMFVLVDGWSLLLKALLGSFR